MAAHIESNSVSSFYRWCLIFALALGCWTTAWAQAYEFRVIDQKTSLGDEIGFYGRDYADNRSYRLLSNEQPLSLEIALGQYADIYAKEYQFDFYRSLISPAVDERGKPFFPIVSMRDTPKSKHPPYTDFLRGPSYTSHKNFDDLGNALILTDGGFWAATQYKFPFEASVPFELRYPFLGAAATLTQTAISSECERDIWPDYTKSHTNDIGIKQYPTLTNTVLNNLAIARAIDIWEGNSKKFNDDRSTAKMAAIADAIAKMSLDNRRRYKEKAERLAEAWLGRYNLSQGGITSAKLGLAGSAARFLSPIELIDMSQELPSSFYWQNSKQVNMLKDFKLDFDCSERIQAEQAAQIIADAFKSSEQYLPARDNGTPFRHRDILVQAQIKKIQLPYIAAEQQLKDVSIYENTLLSPDTWEKSLFNNGKGCTAVNLDNHPAGFFGDMKVTAFGAKCLKLTWSHDETKPLSIDVRTPDEGEDPAKTLDSIRTYQDMRRLTGITTRLLQYQDGKSTSGLKSYLSVTENFMRDIGGAKSDKKETRLYFHNVAKEISNTRDLNIEVTITTPKTEANITAVDYKKGKKNTDPPIVRRMPALPKSLVTSATIDLQSKKEYSDPKLTLTFSHLSEFNDIYEDIAKVQADGLSDLSTAGGSDLGVGNPEEFTQKRAENVTSLLKKMMELQKNAQNEQYGESIHVIIEAPAPPFGYTGTIDDVLISVNWQDSEGKPGDAESIGPSDMSASPYNEVYLNNGILNVTKFTPELFVATFSGTLTDDPILPPMGPRVPHKDRVVTGQASGTLVIAMPDLGAQEDREIATQYLEQDLTLNYERLSNENKYDPLGDSSNDSGDGRTGNTNSPAGLASSGINNHGCNCSCDVYWNGVDSGQGYSTAPSKACVSHCAEEYMLCRAKPPKSAIPKAKTTVAKGEQRRVAYAEEIEFYARSIGLNTPEMIEAYAQGIVNASDDEVRQLLEIVKKMREAK